MNPLFTQPKGNNQKTEVVEPGQRKSQRMRMRSQLSKHDHPEHEGTRSSKKQKIGFKNRLRTAAPKCKAAVPSFPNLEIDGGHTGNGTIFRTAKYNAELMPSSKDSSTRSSGKSSSEGQSPDTSLTGDGSDGSHLHHHPKRANDGKSSQPASSALTSHTSRSLTSDVRALGKKRQAQTSSDELVVTNTIAEASKATAHASAFVKQNLPAPYESDRLQRPKLPRVVSGNQRATRNSAPNALPSWADPKDPQFEIIRWLKAEKYHPVDPLVQTPPPNYTYADSSGRLKNPHKYAKEAAPQPAPLAEHPKIAYHRKNGTLTQQVSAYYKDMPKDRVLPLAGSAPPDTRTSIIGTVTSNSPTISALVSRKASAIPLFPGLAKRREAAPVVQSVEETANIPLLSSCLDWRHVQLQDDQLTSLEQEENFYARPSVKIPIPDHIKAILVDDWENVTKSQMLVPLPAEKPVETMLDDYLASERPKRIEGTSSMDILEEVIAGLKEYFERCLGRILLYRCL